MSTTMKHYGGSFGDDQHAGVFPTQTNEMHTGYPWNAKNLRDRAKRKLCKIACKDSSAISRVDEEGNPKPRNAQYQEHTAIDETFMTVLQNLRWTRDDGIIELMPIAVVHVDRTC